jgi:hypothetical protein
MSDTFSPHGFDGVWQMYLPDSKIKDPVTGEWAPEVLKDQVLRIRTDGDVMDYRIRVDHPDGASVYMKYTCKFNDTKWVPYFVYHIEGERNPAFDGGPNSLLKQGTHLGKPIAYIKQIYVDERTQYRITKNPDGTAQYCMERRLSEDGSVNVGYVLSAEGVFEIAKHFTRMEEDPEWHLDQDVWDEMGNPL